MTAIKDQVNSLINKDTWRLVLKVKGMKVLPGKWVYDYKYHLNSDVDQV